MKVRDLYSERVGTSDITFDPKERRTKSSFKAECDINTIVNKIKKGLIPPGSDRVPRYGDLSDMPTYQESLDIVRRADEIFDSLPALVRRECNHDPAVFLERVQDPAWAEKHQLSKPKPPSSQPAGPASPPAGQAGGQSPPATPAPPKASGAKPGASGQEP